ARWPDACDAELRAHVDACASCRELALVAGNVLTDANAAMREASIPSSGAMWWRIQRRTHAEAARSASRLITFVQIGSIAAVAIVAIALLGGLPALHSPSI